VLGSRVRALARTPFMGERPGERAGERGRLKARLLKAADRAAAVALLEREPLHNLQLLDLASRLGERAVATEVTPQLVGAFRGRELLGVASLRPSLGVDFHADEQMLDLWMPFLEVVPSGLMKGSWDTVSSLWQRFSDSGRGFIVDRAETAYRASREKAVFVDAPPGVEVRCACQADLGDLVAAARASLREEGRPDPFDGDPVGFRRWVRGRLHRARVIVKEDRVLFVGYADVRRSEGWLVQGVYTFPEARRCGFASAGMSALVREAFDAGADHVQLAVVSGNAPAARLYEQLGFEAFGELRTVLFL
jgi:ribosomal protein S18 acetylase RimI-like enzyme